MVMETKKGPLTNTKSSNNASGTELFTKLAFLKPPKGQPVHFGANNEENVLKSVQNSLEQHRQETEAVQPPVDVGLIACVTKLHLRMSTDGLVSIKVDGNNE